MVRRNKDEFDQGCAEKIGCVIEHFFSVYKDLENKRVRSDGWDDREAAFEIIRECSAPRG